MKPHLLFVEDDDALRGVLTRELADFGYEVSAFAAALPALEHLSSARVDLGLFDLRLPDLPGQELLERALEVAPGLPVVFLTGHGALPDAVRAIRAGAYDFLVKPAALDALELALGRALEHGQLLRQNRVLRTLTRQDVGAEILGASEATRTLREQIARVARSDASVLVLGENGTGKELVARATHAASPRAREPFVVVNCGAIPSELFESELFGHVSGAFTGASRERLGLFALADGGTLFLDEIGELPRDLQPALLRAVQFGEYRPVGAERVEEADVRILAATHRDLEAAVEAREFRADLYHRLSVLTLEVAPLRERGEDVRLLARAFLQRLNDQAPAAEQRSLSPSALQRLCAHTWPGNVRELENVILRLFTLADGAVLDDEDVERHVGRAALVAPSTLDLEALERAAVVEALRRHAGHRAKAAAELGVAVKTLYNKIRHHGVEGEEWS